MKLGRIGAVLGGLTVAYLGFLASPALAQDGSALVGEDGISKACRAEEFRQFDFWLGDWTVYGKDDQVVGHNRIERVAAGCGVLESWRSASGPPGTSLNMYDPETERWSQTWVGGGGQILHLYGGLEGDNMVLSGERRTDEGTVVDRITWIPIDDGRVRQVWDISSDGGATWETVFNGLYVPREGSGS